MPRDSEIVLVALSTMVCWACGGYATRQDAKTEVANDRAVEAPAADAGRADAPITDVPVDASAADVDALDLAAADATDGEPAAIDASLDAGRAELAVDVGESLAKVFACGQLLSESAALLTMLRDPWTGLPYDHIPCGGPYATSATGMNPAFGVVPQLAYATLAPFSEDPPRATSSVSWAFVDETGSAAAPTLLFALKVALALDQGAEAGTPNRFGGVIWRANADISRYKQIRIRYRTSDAEAAWQLKLNSGTTTAVEPAFALSGSLGWKDVTVSIAEAFPGTDPTHLNYLTFATSIDASGATPTLWVDQVSFMADPDRLGDCSVTCPTSLPPYPDLACYEPQTGAVNVANAVTFLATAPAAGLLTEEAAKTQTAQILGSLEQLPAARPATRANGKPYAGGDWLQDWHSPVSLMPDARNRMGSLTDLPQLFAALLVLETTWPDLAARAAAVRGRMDFSVLYDDSAGCPGVLRPGIDRCAGVNTAWAVDRYGTDYLLGAYLAEATGAAPVCLWRDGLAKSGCALAGPSATPWYNAGSSCANASIPASDSGGPFLQLAALLYLSSTRIPMGPLSLATSAENMLRAQYAYASAQQLILAGWSNAADADGCGYASCEAFTADKATPYVSAMAASDAFPETYRMLRAFHLLGADAQLDTGKGGISLGLRDSWNQSTASARDNFLYLDTGWSVLGLLNACQADVVRKRFAAHPVAKAGYAAVQSDRSPCP